jgi:hypothetical protein
LFTILIVHCLQQLAATPLSNGTDSCYGVAYSDFATFATSAQQDKWKLTIPRHSPNLNAGKHQGVQLMGATHDNGFYVGRVKSNAGADDRIPITASLSRVFRGESTDILILQFVVQSPDSSLLLAAVQGVGQNKTGSVLVISLDSNSALQQISLPYAGDIFGASFLQDMTYTNRANNVTTDNDADNIIVFANVDATEAGFVLKPVSKPRKNNIDESSKQTQFIFRRAPGSSAAFALANMEPATQAAEYVGAHCCQFQALHHAFFAVAANGSSLLVARKHSGPGSAGSSNFAGSMYPPGFRILMQVTEHRETETELDYEPNNLFESGNRGNRARLRDSSPVTAQPGRYIRKSKPAGDHRVVTRLVPVLPEEPILQTFDQKEKNAVVSQSTSVGSSGAQVSDTIVSATAATPELTPLHFLNAKKFASTIEVVHEH